MSGSELTKNCKQASYIMRPRQFHDPCYLGLCSRSDICLGRKSACAPGLQPPPSLHRTNPTGTIDASKRRMKALIAVPTVGSEFNISRAEGESPENLSRMEVTLSCYDIECVG